MALTAFSPIPTTDLDYSSPTDNDLFVALRDCNDHSRQTLYDVASHVPVKAHDHDGRNSTKIATTSFPNLIYDGHASRGWTLSGGAAHSANGLVFSGTGQRGTKQLLREATPSHAVNAFGSNGCTLLVALVARIVGSVTAATFNVGFANGDANPSLAQGTFTFGVPGLHTVTTSWKRYFGFWTPFVPAGGWTACRASIATQGTWTGAGTIQIDYVLVRPTDRLCYWVPGYSESRHPSWKGVQGGDASLYDRALNFTNAVEVGVV